jgi:phosphatidylinositol glycan class B
MSQHVHFMPDRSVRPSETLSAAPWSMVTFLLVGLLLRLPAVLWADGYEYPDQQYQYVDPAWHLATGQAWHRTWEWIDGLRSLVYPEMLAGVFRGLLGCGLHDPMWSMRAVRGVHALVSLLPLWLFWLLVVRWRPLPCTPTRRLALLLFAGSGFLVTTGVQPSGPALAATLAVAAALAVHGPRWFPLLGGLCLGLAFCCRFQEALFGPPLFVVLCWQRRWRAAAWFLFGCLPGVLLQGFVDLQMHGRFLATVWTYVESNVVHGAADRWRQQPWWFYVAAGVVPTLALVPPWWRAAWRRVVAGARVVPGVAAAALFHIALHSCIGRKAMRFEYGAMAMLVAVVAVGLAALPSRPGERLARWHTGALVVVHALFFCYASFWFGNAGPVRAALALRGDPALAGEVLVVDGDGTSLGGFFYLQPPADHLVGVARAGLRERLLRSPPSSGTIVVAVREPLGGDGLDRLEPVGTFTGMFDLRRSERRFLYRWR